MPIYEFVCPNGHCTEVLVYSFAHRPAFTPCECGARAMPVVSRTNWQVGAGPQARESPVARAIQRVKQAKREGRA